MFLKYIIAELIIYVFTVFIIYNHRKYLYSDDLRLSHTIRLIRLRQGTLRLQKR